MNRSRNRLLPTNKATLIVAVSFAINLLTQTCASAQAVTESTQPAEMRPGVRYTTGSYRISGWENELVKGDPNLGHWNWSAMVGYTQSMGSKHTGKGATAAPLSPVAMQRSHYVKYNHVPTMVPAQQLASRPDVSARMSSSDVSASLRPNNSHNAVSGMLRRPIALSYGGDYHNSTGSAMGTLEHKDVFGQITHRSN